MPVKEEGDTTKLRKSRRASAIKYKARQQQDGISTTTPATPITRRKMYRCHTMKQNFDKASRLCLPSWLEEQINSGKYRGLKWTDRGKMTFSVPWKHGSQQGWNKDEDAKIFKAWATYTGVYDEGNGVY